MFAMVSERSHPERIPKLKVCKGRRDPAGPFADLTWQQQRAAEQWFWKFCQKWGNDLPNWRRGILIGVARRLAKKPPTKGWGKQLHGHLGANALADQCRAERREHPRIAAMLAARRRPSRPLPSRQLSV